MATDAAIAVRKAGGPTFTFGEIVAISIVLAVMWVFCGIGIGGRSVRRDAVKAGVAEFRADAEGNVTFHWLKKGE